jgi:hypothetical protein
MSGHYGHHKCLTCSQWITYRFAICSKCEKTYGKSARKWPEWLRFLWNDTQRERRRNKKVRQHEITFSELEDSTDDD